MNNTPDYDNNLAFEPKIPVYPYTWGDLQETARKHELYYPTALTANFNIGQMMFCRNGEVRANGVVIAHDRTPEQMKNIIDNLWG